MSEEKLSFQAEVSRLLDIVANSLYSNREIFLRELISNASDACDRLRYAALTRPELTAEDPEFRIMLSCDANAKTVVVADNGIGMNREELIENLGTIARSGSAAFVQQMEETSDGVNLIGKFGVGFYSAYMVSDRVEVTSRKAGEAEGWRWVSDGRGEFTVAEAADAPARGTRIALHVKKGEEEFLDSLRLERIVRTYSDHIAIPVVLAKADGTETTVNSASALWTRPRSEITDEQHKEFYHHVAHAFDEPWLKLHFKAEGKIEYTGLLYVPSSAPFDMFSPERKHGVKLYVKRVFITDDCEGLIPPYLRFLRGVIDSEDLPLNISREVLQHNPMVVKIRNAVTKRVLGELKKRAEKTPEDYAKFWDSFGAVLKEGLYEDEGQREALFGLARFASTRGEAVSLADYLARMPEGQEAIYYISGDELEGLRRSPQIEGFVAKGVEVLLLTDPVDEFWIPSVMEFEGTRFKSVTRGAADLDAIKGTAADAESEAEQAPPAAGVDALVAFVKLALKDEVKDVRSSQRLTDSPVCLVAEEGDMDIHLERLLKQHRQIDRTSKRVLEINPRHSLIRSLAGALESKGATAGETTDGGAPPLEEAARLLLDQALILEGEPLPDPGAFARRLSRLVERGFAPAA